MPLASLLCVRFVRKAEGILNRTQNNTPHRTYYKGWGADIVNKYQNWQKRLARETHFSLFACNFSEEEKQFLDVH
jgi:hypothetical protein